jgi:hypothetical protein
MHIKRLFWLVPGIAAALVCATCAPVDMPPPEARNPANSDPAFSAPTPIAQPEPRPASVKDRIELAIEQVRRRELLTTHAFWTVFHGILGLGPAIELHNPLTGQKVNALDYICTGGKIRGLEFLPTKDGLDVRTGPQFEGQGHQDQFIAEMAQWGMPLDRRFQVLGKEYTFADFVRHTKARARVTENQELSWAILVLGQYEGTDIAWTNSFGEALRFEDLVRYELDQPVETAACGGTHRLFGLSWVYHLHMLKGGKKTGVWQEIADKEDKYAKLAKQWQHPDGSFSTEFFRSSADSPNPQLRMNTSGHILEWLALALPDSEIKKPWVEAAANAVALMFLDIQRAEMEGGTLYHAVHGLIIYYARMFEARKLGPQEPPIPLLPEQLPAKKR